MVAKEKTFVAPLANLHCFRTHHVLASAADPLRFPGEKSLFFPWWGKRGGGLRKGKFIHPSDAEESSLFLPPFSLPWRSLIRKAQTRDLLLLSFAALLSATEEGEGRRERGEQTLRKAWKVELFPRRRRRRREVEGEEAHMGEHSHRRRGVNFSPLRGGVGFWGGRVRVTL